MEYQGLRASVDAGIGLAVKGEISFDHLPRGFTPGVIQVGLDFCEHDPYLYIFQDI